MNMGNTGTHPTESTAFSRMCMTGFAQRGLMHVVHGLHCMHPIFQV